jgi:hypothetical protein
MTDFTMTDIGGLMHARARDEFVLALSFVLENCPTFEYIDELKIKLVTMPLPRRIATFAGTDHVHHSGALSRLENPQITIVKIFAQTIVCEGFVFGVLNTELHDLHLLVDC